MVQSSDEFQSAAQAIADERYAGDFSDGFAHLALQLAFPTYEFTDENAEEITSLDRRGDLGADGLLVDDDQHEILLFQSKSSSGLKDTDLHGEISTFVALPTKLLSDDWVKKAHGDMRPLANEFREALKHGYDVIYAFATLSPISATVRSPFADLSDAPGTENRAEIHLLDAHDLLNRYKKLLLSEAGAPTNVQLKVEPDQMHQPGDSTEDVIYLTLPASEYVTACKRYGMELFRFNPRLYLGNNKVNAGISATLKDKQARRYFHLLNNGITAVCREFVVRDAGGGNSVVHVEDFQVVNGCQTTMTLFQNSADLMSDEKCLVDIKIIASPGLRELISQTTNTQTSIVVEDTFANAPEQKVILDRLKRHDPPYFYSAKRGSWEQEKAPERRKYQDDHPVFGKNRRLTSKELAAVCLAAFGEPESAKDKPRIVFERIAGKDSALYDKIFRVNNVAAQWLLPFELLRLANTLVKEEVARAKEICPDDMDCEEALRARIGAYGRFRMVHLVYDYLRKYSGETSEFVSGGKSQELLKTIGNWGRALMQIALDSVVDSYSDAREDDQTSGLREFFREKKHQSAVVGRFNRELLRTERQAKRSKKKLPELLGLAS